MTDPRNPSGDDWTKAPAPEAFGGQFGTGGFQAQPPGAGFGHTGGQPPGDTDWGAPPAPPAGRPGWPDHPASAPGQHPGPPGWSSEPAGPPGWTSQPAVSSGWTSGPQGPPGWNSAPDPARRSGDNWGSLGPSADNAGGWQAPASDGPVQAPIWMLVVGVLLPLAALPGLWMDQLWVHVLCWAVATAGSVGMLAAFTLADLKRRNDLRYVDHPGMLAGLRIAVLAVGLVVAGVFAYFIADAVARLDWWA
jgi:hypothetical protein